MTAEDIRCRHCMYWFEYIPGTGECKGNELPFQDREESDWCENFSPALEEVED